MTTTLVPVDSRARSVWKEVTHLILNVLVFVNAYYILTRTDEWAPLRAVLGLVAVAPGWVYNYRRTGTIWNPGPWVDPGAGKQETTTDLA